MIGKCKGTGEMAIFRHFSVAPLSQGRRFHATASVAVGSTTDYKHPLILRPELGVERKKSGAYGHSRPNGRFLPDTKNMNAKRRPPSCLVPIDFSIVGATVTVANSNDGECR